MTAFNRTCCGCAKSTGETIGSRRSPACRCGRHHHIRRYDFAQFQFSARVINGDAMWIKCDGSVQLKQRAMERLVHRKLRPNVFICFLLPRARQDTCIGSHFSSQLSKARDLLPACDAVFVCRTLDVALARSVGLRVTGRSLGVRTCRGNAKLTGDTIGSGRNPAGVRCLNHCTRQFCFAITASISVLSLVHLRGEFRLFDNFGSFHQRDGSSCWFLPDTFDSLKTIECAYVANCSDFVIGMSTE